MNEIRAERLAGETAGDVVVFAIGMRINKFWKVWKWLPVFLDMARLLAELKADPSIGLLSSRPMFGFRTPGVLQHWRNTDDLIAYARSVDHRHMAVWKRFNAQVGTRGDVGIWHETYAVTAGSMESVFVNMPVSGLGVAGSLFSAKGDRASAKKRLSRKRD